MTLALLQELLLALRATVDLSDGKRSECNWGHLASRSTLALVANRRRNQIGIWIVRRSNSLNSSPQMVKVIPSWNGIVCSQARGLTTHCFMNLSLKSALLIISVGALTSSCSVTESAYQGDCADKNPSTSIDEWKLAKEVCFTNPTPDNFTLFLRSIGMSRRRIGAFSTQLWLEESSLQRDVDLVKIKFIQQATYESDTLKTPDLNRIKLANINCKTDEFISDGSFKPILEWKKPVIVRTSRGELEDRSSPLNPYVYIKAKYCS